MTVEALASAEIGPFLRSMAEKASMLTAAEVAGEDGDAAATADLLAEAIGLGLVDVVEDCGPEALFTLSTLAAEKLGIRLTYDSRRWAERRTGKLVGPHDPDGRYRPRRASRVADEDLALPLHQRVDARALRPDEIVIADEAARSYGGDDPAKAPTIYRFYGLGTIWAGEEEIVGTCPFCGGKGLDLHAYCLKCHNAGMDRLMERPKASLRRQMPRGKSKLKGGVR